MFNFRIINLPDGNQIIDSSIKTPYNSLTPLQMVEYIEMDAQIAYMNRMEQKAKAEVEHQRKITKNLFYRIACFCGIVQA